MLQYSLRYAIYASISFTVSYIASTLSENYENSHHYNLIRMLWYFYNHASVRTHDNN